MCVDKNNLFFQFSSFRDLKCLSGYSIEVLDLSRNPVSDIKEKKYYKQ